MLKGWVRGRRPAEVEAAGGPIVGAAEGPSGTGWAGDGGVCREIEQGPDLKSEEGFGRASDDRSQVLKQRLRVIAM